MFFEDKMQKIQLSPLFLKNKKNIYPEVSFDTFLHLCTNDNRNMDISLNQKVLAFFICKSNYEDLLAFCTYLTNDVQKAEDITQETFLRLVQKQETVDSKVHFPEDAQDFKNYVKAAAKNYYLESLRSNKGLTNGVDREIGAAENEILDEKNFNAMQKLDNLHVLILKNSSIFTEAQLQLWNYMYECKPIEQIIVLMRRDKQTVYSLKNKLKAKIRKNFSLEMLTH